MNRRRVFVLSLTVGCAAAVVPVAATDEFATVAPAQAGAARESPECSSFRSQVESIESGLESTWKPVLRKREAELLEGPRAEVKKATAARDKAQRTLEDAYGAYSADESNYGLQLKYKRALEARDQANDVLREAKEALEAAEQDQTIRTYRFNIKNFEKRANELRAKARALGCPEIPRQDCVRTPQAVAAASLADAGQSRSGRRSRSSTAPDAGDCPATVPRGTVTLTNTLSAGRPSGQQIQYTLSAVCTATLTYTGGELIKVDETLTWSELWVKTSSNGAVSRVATERRGEFHGTIVSNGSKLRFSPDRNSGKLSYSFVLTTPRGKMPVEETIVQDRTAASGTSTHYDTTLTYYAQCWNDQTPRHISGVSRKSAAVSGSLSRTVDIGAKRLHWELRWALRPGARP